MERGKRVVFFASHITLFLMLTFGSLRGLQPQYPVRVLVQNAVISRLSLPTVLEELCASLLTLEDSVSMACGAPPKAPPMPTVTMSQTNVPQATTLPVRHFLVLVVVVTIWEMADVI